MQSFGVMMNDMMILNELINNEALVPLETGDYGKLKVTLIEPENSELPAYKVDIQAMPENAIVIKIDEFPAPKPIFKGDKGECKRADFAIITDKLIVLIELKSGQGKNSDIIQQLKGAQSVIDYFRTIVKNFWNEANFLDMSHYQYRFVSIKSIGLNKKMTFQRENSDIHDLPAQMLKIKAPNHLQFNQLIRSPS